MAAIDNIIRKLRTLDSNAADYVQKQYDEGNISSRNLIDTPQAISYLFTWSRQPQGEAYWYILYTKYFELSRTTPKGNMI